MESKVEVDYVCESGIHKSKCHKKKSAFYFWNPKWKWTRERGINFPQNTWPVKNKRGWDNLWSRCTKFENIVEFVTFILLNSTIFLGPTNFLWNRICEFCFRKYSNKGHEFHNIFEFSGTIPQIIPTQLVKYFLENWFLFCKSISTLDSTNKIQTFFEEFRFVNSAYANTLFSFRKHSDHIVELTLKSYNTQNMHIDNQTYWIVREQVTPLLSGK